MPGAEASQGPPHAWIAGKQVFGPISGALVIVLKHRKYSQM